MRERSVSAIVGIMSQHQVLVLLFFNKLPVTVWTREWCCWKGIANRHALIPAIFSYAYQLPRNSSLKVRNRHCWHNEPAPGAEIPFFKYFLSGEFYRSWWRWKGIENRHAMIQAILKYAYQLPRNSSLKVRNGNCLHNEQFF
jgi:hypothetical protein